MGKRKNYSKTKTKTGGDKSYYKDKSKYDDTVEKQESKTDYKAVGKTHNDWRWYVENEQMLKDVASLSYGQALGLPTGIIDGSNPAFYNTSTTRIPGVCEIRMVPSIGCAKEAVDGATLASLRLYNYVRAANSGAANYESADLFMYVLAHGQISAWLASLKRVYGIANTFFMNNRYFSASIIRACGFEPDVIYDNLNALRAHINLSYAQLNKLKIPSGMPFIERWKWLNNSIFMDDNSTKSQAYVPRFMYYYKWDGYKSQTGTQLTPVYPAVSSVTGKIVNVTEFQQILDTTSTLLEPLVAESDIDIMSADIRKAFGDSNLSMETVITDDYVTLPAHDATVLAQIHNTVIMSGLDSTDAGEDVEHVITQQNGIITERFSFDATQDARDMFLRGKRYYLDVYTDDPTPEVTIVATRNMPVFTDAATHAGSKNMGISSCGTEIPVGLRIWHGPEASSYTDATNIISVDSTANTQKVIFQSCFNWHPLTYIFGSGKYLGVLGDLENYTILNFNTLEQMHRNAIFAIFRTGN